MDFDKQFRSGAPTNMVNKGRGFSERRLFKPAIQKAAIPAVRRPGRPRSTRVKITPKTQLYIDIFWQ